MSGTEISSPSMTSVPTESITSSNTVSRSLSSTASSTKSPGASASRTPSASSSATPTRSMPPPPPCEPDCVKTQGYWGQHDPSSQHEDPTWQLIDPNALLCGHTYVYWLESSNINGEAPEHWLNLVRQWIAVVLNLLTKGCSKPMPLRVANAFEEARIILTDPDLCLVNDASWSKLTDILTDYNEGSYSNRGGPPHCDSDTTNEVSGAVLPSVSASNVGCCVLDMSQWLNGTEYLQYMQNLWLCSETIEGMLFGQSDSMRIMAVRYMNQKLCGAERIYPLEAEEMSLRLENILIQKNCTDSVESDEFAMHINQYNEGEYWDIGGPCMCSDTPCLLEQNNIRAESGASFPTIVHEEKKERRSLSPGTLALTFFCGMFCAAGILFIVYIGLIRKKDDEPTYTQLAER